MPHGPSHGHQTYYVPESSKYPFLATIGLGTFILGLGLTLNHIKAGTGGTHWMLPVGFVFFIAVLWNWFGATIRENRAGLNSPQLKKSYVLGMQWFIFSEVMFFFAFFFALAYVRIYVVPWFFRIPGFRRYHGYTFWRTILLKGRGASDDLVTHELCHVWQAQHHPFGVAWKWLTTRYRSNPYEIEARRAVSDTSVSDTG